MQCSVLRVTRGSIGFQIVFPGFKIGVRQTFDMASSTCQGKMKIGKKTPGLSFQEGNERQV